MAQKTAEIDITALFGEPEDNSEEVWDTGFKVVGQGTIIDKNNEKTGYAINTVYKYIINSEGKVVAYISGQAVPFICDTEGNKTNYFLNSRRILRISGKK